MAIRRPPTTFSDSITGADLASDIAISTTGNIATTGSGTLTVAGNTTLSGTNNLGSNPTVTLGSNATGGSGLTAHGRIGQSCQIRKQTNTSNLSQATAYNVGTGSSGGTPMDSDGWEEHSNSDSSIFTTSSQGITVSLAGTYLANYAAYFSQQSSTSGYMEVFLKVDGVSILPAYHIQNNATGGHSNQYMLQFNSTAISLSANELVDLGIYRSNGTFRIVQDHTFIRLTYLSDDTFSNSY